MDCMLFI